MRMKLNRKYILSRGQIFVGMSIGMLLGFTPQFWAPWPKDSGIFYLQSIGFGLLLAAYTLFTGYVFQGILAKSNVLVKLRRTLLSENFHTPMGSSHCWLYAAV